LIGYLGSKDATWREKVAWNVADWKMKINGKFRNECGAHAGFSSAELASELCGVFGYADNITLPYYRAIYPRHTGMVRLFDSTGASRFVFPSVYFAGTVGV